ncbi:MAG: exopolyphosphatase [bacterium]|nr:exopolyphosphatase [bacterium]
MMTPMRIVTRADLDGIACAVLLRHVVTVSDYRFTEAFPLQHGELAIQSNDIITNLPYAEGCALWFDHHASNEPKVPRPGKWAVAPSAARVVYDYYGHNRFPGCDRMVVETDRVDSATITAEEIANPSGYFLLELTINPKKPADEPYWRKLINLLFEANGEVEPVLQESETAQRAHVVLSELDEYRDAISSRSRLEKMVVVTDLRGLERVPAENRFLVYGMFPAAEVSIKLAEVHNEKGHMVKISLGRSILNTRSTVNLGELLTQYGGGGHTAAGSVHVPFGKEEAVYRELLTKIQAAS